MTEWDQWGYAARLLCRLRKANLSGVSGLFYGKAFKDADINLRLWALIKYAESTLAPSKTKESATSGDSFNLALPNQEQPVSKASTSKSNQSNTQEQKVTPPAFPDGSRQAQTLKAFASRILKHQTSDLSMHDAISESDSIKRSFPDLNIQSHILKPLEGSCS